MGGKAGNRRISEGGQISPEARSDLHENGLQTSLLFNKKGFNPRWRTSGISVYIQYIAHISSVNLLHSAALLPG
jgi:hypothetical protein